MGARGKGARPLGPLVKTRAPWQRKGLSRAERVIAFVETLKVTSGLLAGQPFKVRPWQADFIRAVYDPPGPDARRLVRTALLTIPRKNGKSGLAAALALAHLCGPEAEPRGQIYSAAADRMQAGLIFNELEAMILADSALASRCNIRRFHKDIEDRVTGSRYQALSSEAYSKHGLSPSLVIYDELAQAPNRELYDVLTTGMGARAEPLMVVISTMSPDPLHIMSELVEYGRKVGAGEIVDPSFAAAIYGAARDAPPWAEATWHACNPALGDFRSLEEMRVAAERAQRMPSFEASFRLLYLNQPVETEASFIPEAEWEACAEPVDLDSLKGQPCFAGLDLSETRDLTALVLWFPRTGEVLPTFWLPDEGLADRAHSDRVPYVPWREADFLATTQGRTIDQRAVLERLAEINELYDVRGIAFDRWRFKGLQKLLDDAGLVLPLVPWGQGWQDMSPAVDALERAVLERRLRHGGHPILRWNLSNARVQTDPAGNRKLVKRSDRRRVDGIVALAMACGLAAREPIQARGYDFDRELVLLA